MSSNPRTRVYLLSVAALGLFGFAANLHAVPARAGGTWDSVVFAGTARNLAAGLGFTMAHVLPRTPYTFWAPLYPFILSIPARLHVDPAESAKWINAVCFALEISLTGIAAWFWTGRSYAAGILAALCVLCSVDMLTIHAEVMSEPSFILLTLVTLVTLLSYCSSSPSNGRWRLLKVAAAASLVLLTRYAGISIVVACFVIFLASTWKRLREIEPSKPELVRAAADLALLCLVVLLPAAVWSVRTMLVRSIVEPRVLAFHPPSRSQLSHLVGAMTLWFVPESTPRYLRLAGLLGLVFVAAATLVSALRSRAHGNGCFESTLRLGVISLIFDVCYLAVLLVTVSFYDRDVPLDMRLSLPMYPLSVLLLVSVTVLRRELYGRRSPSYVILCVGSLFVIASNGTRFFHAAERLRESGIGFQEVDWKTNPIIERTLALAPDTAVYSDNPNLLYYWTRRAVFQIPVKYNIMTTRVNEKFEAQMKAIVRASRPALVVQFYGDWVGGPFPTNRELIDEWGFRKEFAVVNGARICGEGFHCWSNEATILSVSARDR